ncbi:MAG: hypothetical protein IT337_06780 [Thermomicrobiales bacterium]|nr:hypothetical protein [Thermomicrobiales bacterium]
MSDDVRSTVAYRFLSGANMDPTAARAAYPGSRFVARAVSGEGAARVWGILLAIDPAQVDPALPECAVTADGRVYAAFADDAPTGDPRAVLAAARYWELPPDYVRALAAQAETET